MRESEGRGADELGSVYVEAVVGRIFQNIENC